MKWKEFGREWSWHSFLSFFSVHGINTNVCSATEGLRWTKCPLHLYFNEFLGNLSSLIHSLFMPKLLQSIFLNSVYNNYTCMSFQVSLSRDLASFMKISFQRLYFVAPLPGLVVRVPGYRSEVRFRFAALPDLLKSSGSGTGSTQPRKDDWGAISRK
jgi:hypothetical protein